MAGVGARLHPAFSCAGLCLPISLGSGLGQGPGTRRGRTASPAAGTPEVGRLGSRAPPGPASAGRPPQSLAAPPTSLARTWPARDVVEVTHPAGRAGQAKGAGQGGEGSREAFLQKRGDGNWLPRSGPSEPLPATQAVACGAGPPKGSGAKLGADLPGPALAWRGEPACPPVRPFTRSETAAGSHFP